MIAPATTPLHDRDSGQLLVIESSEQEVRLHKARHLADILDPTDLLVVNDAATLPALVRARTASGDPLELRLASQLRPGTK